MKLRKSVFAAIAATLLIAVSMQAKDEMKRIYIFGFASSFNDSIVCFTDVQAVDSAWLNSKNHFLVSRENYSYQLRDYLGRRLQTPHLHGKLQHKPEKADQEI